jgi:regulator of nonsense transcripts 1
MAATGDEYTGEFDESVLGRPRRHDDDDDGSENGDDDLESTTSAPAAGNMKNQGNLEEEKELPPHACA